MAAISIVLFGCGSNAAGQTKTNGSPTTDAPTTEATTEATNVYPEPDKLIALTFDDGPNENMGTIVETLDQYDAKATFFVIGNKISTKTMSYISTAFDHGHEIGNHSFSHLDMTLMTESEILEDTSKVQEMVANITGVAPVWYRAPFLRANELVYSLIDMPFAACSVDSGDGSNDNSAADRFYKVTSRANDGAIVLMHCNYITATVLPQILEELKMQGYEFVTISQLFEHAGVVPDTTVEFQYKNPSTK